MAHRRPIGWLATLAVTYLGVLTVNRSLIEVRGDSMEPSLWAGDRLLTLPAWVLRPRPGRIVVARDPSDPTRILVKRVHAEVGAHHLDLRGDAADRSTDSRTYGPLPRSTVRRVVVARWPDLRTPLSRPVPRPDARARTGATSAAATPDA